MANAAVDLSAIGFELRFTWASRTDAAAELRHLDASSAEPGQQIFQLRQFHLQLAFTGASVFSENVEDKLRAIDDPRADGGLYVALLGRGQVVIKKDEIGRYRSYRAGNFFQLAAADQRGRIRAVAMLQEFSGDFGAGADRQAAQFVQRLFGGEFGNRRRIGPRSSGRSITSGSRTSRQPTRC